MIRILIQGIHGKMGRTLCELIGSREDCCVAAGVDPRSAQSNVPVFASISQVNVPCDVLIDFSSPSALPAAAAWCAQHKVPYVVCTTGLAQEHLALLTELSHTVPVFRSANMSLGVNLLMELAKQANAVLGTQFDIEIVEKHHHNKLDAPSGTALMIGDAIRAASPVPYHYVYDRHESHAKRDVHEIGMHSVRGGSIVGEHEVIFAGPDEVITLSHSAASRDVFASGAVRAALFLCGKSAGIYEMKDLISYEKTP